MADARSVRPAPAVWGDWSTVEELGHEAYFRRFGFTVVPKLLSWAQVAEGASELDRIVSRWEDIPNVRVIGTRNPLLPSYDLEDASPEVPGPPLIRKLTGLRSLSPTLAGYVIDYPPLLDILHRLMGSRIDLYRDAIMFKPARVGQEKPWHQDAVYWPFRPMTLVSAMVAIDSCGPENGCLQVVPASHTRVSGHAKLNWELQLDIGQMQDRAVYVPLEKGDCLIFHSLLVHASEHNDSDVDRRVSLSSYTPGNVVSLDPDIEPPVVLSQRGLAQDEHSPSDGADLH